MQNAEQVHKSFEERKEGREMSPIVMLYVYKELEDLLDRKYLVRRGSDDV